MTRFWLVRHGPTHQTTFTGWRDVPADLSDTAALERVNAYLPDDAVITSSDLMRAVQTADAIAGARARLPAHRSLREFDFGLWDGLHHTQVTEMDPDLARRFWEEPGDLAAPEGESWNAVADRVSAALMQLAQAETAENIAVVGHMGMIMTMIAQCGGTPYAAMGHKIDNLSITDMRYDGRTWDIGTINHRA